MYTPNWCRRIYKWKRQFLQNDKPSLFENWEKNQNIIVIGDLNAETSLANRKCPFDGSIIIQDAKFNDNGTIMKKFCRKNKLGIASTFFEYTPEQRFTWYSCDKITRKINDYVLPESYVQYITDCIACPAFDFDSDHRILVTHINTPMTIVHSH